jgi:hypothetical protein
VLAKAPLDLDNSVMELLRSPVAPFIDANVNALLIMDTATTYTWVRLMQTKDQAHIVIRTWFDRIDRHSSPETVDTTVRTDNSGEFIGKYLQELPDRKIHFEAASPYKHVHLGEQTNRTIPDAAHAFMFTQNIKASF